jgi:hypothetical protein
MKMMYERVTRIEHNCKLMTCRTSSLISYESDSNDRDESWTRCAGKRTDLGWIGRKGYNHKWLERLISIPLAIGILN